MPVPPATSWLPPAPVPPPASRRRQFWFGAGIWATLLVVLVRPGPAGR